MRVHLVVFVILCAPMGGCFGESSDSLDSTKLGVGPETLISGLFQEVVLTAEMDLSVLVPYLVKDSGSGFVQNSTLLDMDRGDELTIEVLAPPRTETFVLLLGEKGRDIWPVRKANESWDSWLGRGGDSGSDSPGVTRVDQNSSQTTLSSSLENGGAVVVKVLQAHRQSSVSIQEGGSHSSGIVHGRVVYDRLFEITDPTDSIDPIDGKRGYWDRWAGQGNPGYEDAAQYLISELSSFGLDVTAHRFEFTDIFGIQNPESYNICAYKWGSLFENEWLVFGAHFDVAPPANLVMLDPHLTGQRTYGTRVGAYDNSAGTSMVLETARALTMFESRRTMVFCFWSGEEGGKRGSDYWTEYFVKEDNPDVTVTNYINLDMGGVNWPGGGGAPHGDPDPQLDEDGYPKDTEVWPMRVYIGPGPNHDRFDQPEMIGLSNWIGADALGLEDQIGTLLGANYSADTWKTNVWLDMDRPEVIVYEDTTARSDHASFQDNLGTVTLGFGGLVDGYWCYHQTCDTLEEMEQWMDTTGKSYGEENTGVANLVNSLDMITWWALMTFFHCDESPVLNAL
ncbi:MAG: hypothetical protein CMA00_001755 [Methanobacteriota archaeon]|nr:M20/M25/M40 family metallo-hydrolase [Candidatus Thermoplasmatota archaeon]RAH06681.1 MAG: hypothetical protein CMA00_001755 [Euryarchaeota archaeon]